MSTDVVISKWGCNLGIRFPANFTRQLGFVEGNKVNMTVQDDKIIIKKINPHKTLEERLESFYGKPLEKITPIKSTEYDWGKPEGKEIW